MESRSTMIGEVFSLRRLHKGLWEWIGLLENSQSQVHQGDVWEEDQTTEEDTRKLHPTLAWEKQEKLSRTDQEAMTRRS